jgi:hypothetical protein
MAMRGWDKPGAQANVGLSRHALVQQDQQPFGVAFVSQNLHSVRGRKRWRFVKTQDIIIRLARQSWLMLQIAGLPEQRD